MAILIRIDVDRPYGRSPLYRHVASRCASDLYFPRNLGQLGYLRELHTILSMLGEAKARAYVFFRRCTLPSDSILSLLEAGQHEIGLHLENSRSFATFHRERARLESHIGQYVTSFSKHGSGGAKFGRWHHAPYEPSRYIEWARAARMKVFFGNLEDPTFHSPWSHSPEGLACYLSAFWLEPQWRNTKRFTVDWLIERAQESDVVLLIHPENTLADPALSADLKRIITQVESKII